MGINIDSAIFIGFLVVNLAVGLSCAGGIKTMKDYALGGRSFSTGTIAATLIATWIGGGFFAWNLSKAYSDGLPFVTAVIGNGLAVFILGYFYSLRVGEFLGSSSVAEVMGNLYGRWAKMITSIAAMCLAIGYSGLQIKVLSNLISWSLGVDGAYAAASAATVVIVYSAFGGIRSVTFTDVIQFLTFGAFVPALALLIWGSFESSDLIVDAFANRPQLLDYNSLFTLGWLTLFLWMACPDLDPAMFQRVLIAKDVAQVRTSFIIASIGCITIICITSWIGVLVFAKNPNIQSDQIINYIIQNYSYTGLKGFTMVGIAAMVMSTVDSYINAAAVVFANDFCASVGFKIEEEAKLLSISRIFAVIMGIAALVVALSFDNMFELTLMATNFYMPIVTIPLTLAIFGFRSTAKSILLGMAAGFGTVIIWKNFFHETGIDSAIPSMLANLITIFVSHYLLRQKGGFVGIKDKEPLRILRMERKRKWQGFIGSIKEFSFVSFCLRNSPKQEYVYSYFAIFSIISVFSTIYTLPHSIQQQNHDILGGIYHTVLIISTMFLSYPIWPSTFKNRTFISIFWNIAIFYILISVSMIFILLTNFGQFQLMMLVLNVFVLSSLIRWQVTLLAVPTVCVLTIWFYKWYAGTSELPGSIGDLQFKIIYALLMISSALIGFVKPKQEHQELTEEQNNHLEVMIKDREEELSKAQELKHEFLRNLEHEVNTPLVGLTSLAPMVLEDFDRLSPAQMKKYVKNIVDSHERYKTLSDNLLDLSKLDSMKYKLNKVKLDLSELLKGRLDYCRRLYLYNKELEFAMNIDPNVVIECDEHYIASLLDNLIINAIKYSKGGTITLKLHRKETTKVEFQIIDEGLGIPKNELHDIFGAFVVSSKTRTPSGGRGIGLALCKKIAEVHGGSIRADSDGEKGAAFIVELPMSHTSGVKAAVEQERDILPPVH